MGASPVEPPPRRDDPGRRPRPAEQGLMAPCRLRRRGGAGSVRGGRSAVAACGVWRFPEWFQPPEFPVFYFPHLSRRLL